MEGRFSSCLPRMELFLHCVILCMGLLIVVLNVKLILSLKNDNRLQGAGIVLSLLCSNVIVGLAPIAITVIYFVGATKAHGQSFCDSKVSVTISVVSTVGLIAKICSLVVMTASMRLSKRQTTSAITFIWFIAFCEFGACFDHAINITACKFLWSSISDSIILTIVANVLFCILVGAVALNTFFDNNTENRSLSSLETKNQIDENRTNELNMALSLKRTQLTQTFIHISFLVCWTPVFMCQVLSAIVVGHFPHRLQAYMDFRASCEDYIYIIYLLNSALDPLIVRAVTVHYRQKFS